MKKIGIVGGVGWPATAAYYTAVCNAAKSICPGGSPPMMIESLDMREALASRGQLGNDKSWNDFDRLFVDATNRLADGGCDFAVIASATPHLRFESICKGVEIPLLSILEATARAVAKDNMNRALVLGTTLAMQTRLFDSPLETEGVKPASDLSETQIAAFGKLLDDYFYVGKGDQGREPLIEYCRAALKDDRQTTVILGCTDLILAFPEHAGEISFDVDGLRFVDSMAAHVDAMLNMAIA